MKAVKYILKKYAEGIALDGVSFGEKLNLLKSMLRVTDGEIGSAVNVVGSLVCRWRSGDRMPDRYRDAQTLKRLAEFLIERACLQKQHLQLARLLSIDESRVDAKNKDCVDTLTDFLYNGKPASEDAYAEKSIISAVIPATYIGVQGVMYALALLESKVSRPLETELTVYLSLQYSRLLNDDTVSEIWETLYRMNGNRSVRVVFDSWLTDGSKESDNHVSRNLQSLLPFLQTGRIDLHMIRSTQKFFYHNMTFFAKGAGMVITTEPAGGMGVHISLLTESADYMNGMGAVFADLDRMSKSLARHIGGTKDEAVYSSQLFEPQDDLQILSGGINLLYMDEDSYLSLLKQNGITGSRRQYRHTRFKEDKQRFESFLENYRIKEIISLPAMDKMITDGIVKTPELSFHDGKVEADEAILKSLLEGLLDYIERFDNLSVYFERGTDSEFTCKIKGDRFVLLHTPGTEQQHTVFSDNWMLVYEYIKQFGTALQSELLMTNKNDVKTALQIRLEKLGGI